MSDPIRPLLLDPAFLVVLTTLVTTLFASITGTVVAIIQQVQSKARSAAMAEKVDAATAGLAQQVATVSDHAENTSKSVAEVATNTNGALTKLRADNVALCTENTALRQQVGTLTDLLHARGQSRSTDRIAMAEAQHQQTLDDANADKIVKVEITKLPEGIG